MPHNLDVQRRVSDLIDQALTDVSDSKVSLSAVIHKAIRIARLRGDTLAHYELEMEMVTLGSEASKQLRSTVGARLGAAEAKRLAPRFQKIAEAYVERHAHQELSVKQAQDSEEGVLAQSVPEIEARVARFSAELSSLDPPPGLHPLDLEAALRKAQLMRVVMHANMGSCQAILTRVRERVRQILVEAEHASYFGQTNIDIFERTRRFVDARLSEVAPDVLVQFTAAYQRVAAGDVEARSHALTSCRRVLKSLADRLSPPAPPVKDGQGREIELTDDKYLNRLRQYVKESVGKRTAGELLLAQLDDLFGRLGRLNSIASKGVHAQVSREEVDQCVIQTYLAVGDILRIGGAGESE
jgi:hypothetical protein